MKMVYYVMFRTHFIVAFYNYVKRFLRNILKCNFIVAHTKCGLA